MANCVFCQLPIQQLKYQLKSYSEHLLCRHCKQSIQRNRLACVDCAEPILEQTTTPLRCTNCTNEPPPWDDILCPMVYTYPVQPSLKAFKFHKKVQFGRALLAYFLDTLGNHYAHNPYPTRIMTVPMHARRFRKRGFDANAWLVKTLSRTIPIRVDNHSIIKSKATHTQNSLTREQRMTNLRGSFSISENQNLSGERIAIFDDIMTTGSTLRELTQVIRTQQPASIHIWCLARTPGH